MGCGEITYYNMVNEIQLAIAYATTKYNVSNEFVTDNRVYYDSHFELNLYYADDDTRAGVVRGSIYYDKRIIPTTICYINTAPYSSYDNIVRNTSTFAKEYQGRQLYMACKTDKTKWRVDINQKPDWKYDIDEWNTYFKVFDSNWDNVGKYFYEVKSKLPFKLVSSTLRTDDSAERWVILKDGMLMNLENFRDKAEFDDSVTLKGIPIIYVLLHMLPRVTKFESKVDIIRKVKARIGNNYTKSVLIEVKHGDLAKFEFTACHVYGPVPGGELSVDQINRFILTNPRVWNGCTLKRLPV